MSGRGGARVARSAARPTAHGHRASASGRHRLGRSPLQLRLLGPRARRLGLRPRGESPARNGVAVRSAVLPPAARLPRPPRPRPPRHPPPPHPPPPPPPP